MSIDREFDIADLTSLFQRGIGVCHEYIVRKPARLRVHSSKSNPWKLLSRDILDRTPYEIRVWFLVETADARGGDCRRQRPRRQPALETIVEIPTGAPIANWSSSTSRGATSFSRSRSTASCQARSATVGSPVSEWLSQRARDEVIVATVTVVQSHHCRWLRDKRPCSRRILQLRWCMMTSK